MSDEQTRGAAQGLPWCGARYGRAQRLCPGEGATRGVKDQRGPGMGLASGKLAGFALSSRGRFLGYTQQRVLLGLHEVVVGCIAFFYIFKELS